jgi:uncharacterized membrane protein
MRETLRSGIEILSYIIEVIAVVVILVGVVLALLRLLRYVLQRHRERGSLLQVRASLARVLSVALEFLLAADILATAVDPSWDEIGKLAAIAAIRTVLNYFLERELQHAESEREQRSANQAV